MPRRPDPGARDRILDIAARLFDEHGVHAVGLQQIIDECSCGKNLLYREFPSKDELVAAYLDRCRQDWNGVVATVTEPLADDPAAQLVAIVRAAADKAATQGSRGCPLHNTRAEFPDPDHPAHRVAVEHFGTQRARLREIAARTAAKDPDLLGDRIMLIIDGLYANGAIFGRGGAASTAVTFAEEVIRVAEND